MPAELLKSDAPAIGTLTGGVSYAFGYERQFLRLWYQADGETVGRR